MNHSAGSFTTQILAFWATKIESYYMSSAQTALGVTAAPPAPVEIPAYPDYTPMFAGIIIAVLVAIVIGIVILLRKK